MTALGRAEYAARYGPTVGDRVRLADTDLWVEVEAENRRPRATCRHCSPPSPCSPTRGCAARCRLA
jgi:hypothetical protein